MSLSKPRPILNDMPYHIKKMIVESILSFLDRLPLRKVSKEFMGIVDTAKVEMSIEFFYKTVRIERANPNFLVKTHATDKEVADHFKCFVSKPNITFSEIGIVGDRALFVELVEMLTATVKRPLRVKDFAMCTSGQAKMLEFMEPGTLERMCLHRVDQEEAESVFQMEQWRQAKNVHLSGISAVSEVWWDIPRFKIKHIQSIDLSDLPRILEHLLNSATFLHGAIYGRWTVEVIVKALGGGNWKWGQNEARQFAKKTFPVGNHGSTIVVQVFDIQPFDRRVEFTMNRSDE